MPFFRLSDWQKALPALALLLLAWGVLRRATVCEDAYITFRVVDNVVHGYGLRWNVDERVQSYTNPLWMLLHIPFYAVWENIFAITLILSLACTAAAVAVSIRTFEKPWQHWAPLFILPLAASGSFVRYSTSGLENPLTHLLFACFAWALLRARSEKFWFYISFFCALSLVNRLDTAFFYAPVIACLLVRRFQQIRFSQCFAGALPIILWELFSLFYYGFLFPNTKYAKLNAGIPESDYVQSGLNYVLNLLTADPVAFLLIASAICQPLLRKRLHLSPETVCLSLGVLCYSAYIVAVGGNHVFGRFWSLPVFASAWLACSVSSLRSRPAAALAAVLVLVVALYPGPRKIRDLCPTCFVGHITPKGVTLSPWYLDKLPAPSRNPVPDIVIRDGAGIWAYTAGPAVHVIDSLALTDPLLARLPAETPHMDRVGHLPRTIPKGYLFIIKTGSGERLQPDLALYYTKLHEIISGDLWDVERLRTIWAFNTGAYDDSRQRYLESLKR